MNGLYFQSYTIVITMRDIIYINKFLNADFKKPQIDFTFYSKVVEY